MAAERNTIKGAMSSIFGNSKQGGAAPAPSAGQAGYIPPSRANRRQILSHIDSAAVDQLKQLALENRTTQQALMEEAINLLFVKYGKPPIA